MNQTNCHFIGSMLCPALLCVTLVLGSLPVLAEEPAAGSLTVHGKSKEESVTFTSKQVQKNRFLADFIRWALEDQREMPSADTVLATGSSSMRMWKTLQEDLAPLKVVPRGFGGSEMGHIVLMLDFFQRYPSDKILVYEGDNDLAKEGRSVDKYIKKCKAFVAGMREVNPDVKIYFISTKPSPSRVSATERFAQANKKLAEICAADEGLTFIDVFTPMIGEDGQPRPELFGKDRLHMNEQGYKLWTAEVRKHLVPEAAATSAN